MLDISNIPKEYVSELAGAYMHAKFLYEKDPLTVSGRKQQRIRKWICKHYADLIQKLPEAVNIAKEEYSAAQVLTLLNTCELAVQTMQQQNSKETEAALATFDEATGTALKELLCLIDWPTVTFAGKDIQMTVTDTLACRKVLTLYNAEGVPEEDKWDYCNDLNLIRQEEQNRYCLYGQLQDSFYETETSFALTFESARVETTVYNACCNSAMDENPWDSLRSICYNIGMKAEFPGAVFNEKERKLMPLIREICGLSYWLEYDKPNYQSFPELKTLASQYGCQKAEVLLAKLERIPTEDNAYDKTVQKLLAHICLKQCQPIWRDIYQKLVDSQKDYPSKADRYIDAQSLSEIRKSIQSQMEAKGYTGTYPDFVKTGPMKGIHLENSYGMTYWVGLEKRVQYFVHCTENFEEKDYLTIQFLCGTAFLKKNEKQTDIYDCLFNAKGRRLFKLVHYYVPLPGNEDPTPDDLSLHITFAVKRAECLKLSKAEQKAFYRRSLPGWGMFWGVVLFMGGLFAIAMTLALMLMCILFTAVAGLAADIPEMLREIPWWQILVMCWVGFGGAMSIVEVLAHRK